jgi:hypothetical protein
MQKNKGFSTLFIVIIIGSVALGLILSLSTSSFWNVKSSLNSKNSEQTRALTDSCAEVALEIMRENNAFVGSGSVTLNSNTCNYTISNTGGNNRSIVVSGTINDVVRKVQITTKAFNPMKINSWQEVQ